MHIWQGGLKARGMYWGLSLDVGPEGWKCGGCILGVFSGVDRAEDGPWARASVDDTYATGRRGWVQHFPWLIQGLQNLHSPSLQRSHFQKHSLAKAEQFEQNIPV